MYKHALPLAVILALAGCEDGSGQNPVSLVFTGADDTGDAVDPDPDATSPLEELRFNVDDVAFDDGGTPDDDSDDTLTIEGPPLDTSPVRGVYTRNEALDVDGYQAYLKQDDRLSRVFVAVSAESPDGAVRATSVSDGGQFNIFFRGNHYERLEPLTRPTTTDENGQVSYAGTYAGITNLDDIAQSQRLPLEPTDSREQQPAQPRQTTGRVFMNVDFSDNSVEGTIYDREFTDGKPLPSLALTVDQENASNLDDNGEFSGEIEFSGRPDQGNQGNYAGILGGEDASAMAGVIHLDNIFDPEANDPLDSNFDKEVGTFVLPRCGTESSPELCEGLSDLE